MVSEDEEIKQNLKILLATAPGGPGDASGIRVWYPGHGLRYHGYGHGYHDSGSRPAGGVLF